MPNLLAKYGSTKDGLIALIGKLESKYNCKASDIISANRANFSGGFSTAAAAASVGGGFGNVNVGSMFDNTRNNNNISGMAANNNNNNNNVSGGSSLFGNANKPSISLFGGTKTPGSTNTVGNNAFGFGIKPNSLFK